jgi:peptidoglycan/LPS O-acetylase OafA/YrhL
MAETITAGCPDSTAQVPQTGPRVMGGRRIAALDVMRGLAILGILVIHSTFARRFNEGTMTVVLVLARLFDWAVLAFFFISGFLHDQGASAGVLLKKRLVSLLAPFLLYNAFYNLCFAGFEACGFHTGNFQVNGRLLATGLFQSPAFQLYFLPYLFVVTMVVWALNKLSRRHRGRVNIGMLLLVLVFYVTTGFPRVSHGPDYAKLPLYLGAYLIGLVGRPLFEKPCRVPGMVRVTLGVVLCLLVLLRITWVSLLVPPLLFYAVAATRLLHESRLLASLGKLSGSIYVWHTPVMMPFFTLLLAHLRVPPLLNFGVSFALTLGACVLLRRGVDAFFERVLGMRVPRYITL